MRASIHTLQNVELHFVKCIDQKDLHCVALLCQETMNAAAITAVIYCASFPGLLKCAISATSASSCANLVLGDGSK